MRRKIVLLTGLMAVFALSALVGGCSSEPSCKLLHKRWKACKKLRLSKDSFMSLCEKLQDKPLWKKRIKCSAKSDCKAFKKCYRAAEKTARAERLEKRWKQGMEKAAKGDYSPVMDICKIYKSDMSDKLQQRCKAMTAKATDALMKSITAQRDAGKSSDKCWELKRYAKMAGPAQLKKADLLCKEVALSRTVEKVKQNVLRNLKKESPALPYNCLERRLELHRKLGSPYAKKAVTAMIDLCYKKLGEHMLVKLVPKQELSCRVKDLYKGIKKYKISTPKIDELMKKAAEKCEPKPVPPG